MTLLGALTLTLIMCALAALPSSSVALVIARSAQCGRRAGFATAAGIVAGDLIFMALALFGMTALAEQLGTFFVIIKYAAAAYLIWFGLQLILSHRTSRAAQRRPSQDQTLNNGTLFTSFSAGLFLTLGDVKAIVFYASLLPTFLDLTALTALEIAVMTAITVLSVGSVKAVYAIFGDRLAKAAKGLAFERELKTATGGLMVTTGTYLFVKA